MNSPPAAELREGKVPAPAGSSSGLAPEVRRMLAAIGALPEEGRFTWCGSTE
jgi:hypothetical protein